MDKQTLTNECILGLDWAQPATTNNKLVEPPASNSLSVICLKKRGPLDILNDLIMIFIDHEFDIHLK